MPKNTNNYWKKNVRCLIILLIIWFSVSLGAGVIFVDWLDNFNLPGTGFKLGFWMAQQGSIYSFLIIIIFYVWYMNRLDRQFKQTNPEANQERKENFEI